MSAPTPDPPPHDVPTSPLLLNGGDDTHKDGDSHRARPAQSGVQKALPTLLILAGLVGSWIAMSLLLQVKEILSRLHRTALRGP